MSASISTTHSALTTTAVLLVAVRVGRATLTIQLLSGAGSNYIGATGVTAATGYLLPKTIGGEVSFQGFTGELWGISDAPSGNSVVIVELF